MNFNHTKIIYSALFLVSILLSACGGGGSATPAPTPSYTIGGTVSGLTGTVVLQNNGGDDLIASNGAFIFSTKVASGNAYSVTVLTQPTGQTCSVSTGTGTASGNNVTNVAVVCAFNAFSVGGTVTGLTGSVVLQDNNGDNLTVSANGAFTFATSVASGSSYSVTVLTHPTGQSCSVASGTGTGTNILANVTNVAITCATNTHTVGGNVSLLNGSMVLQNNATDDLAVLVNGPFNFPTVVAYGNPYNVSVLTHPLNQKCGVASGTGTVTANVSNVAISCASPLGGAMQGRSLTLSPTVSTLAGTAAWADGTGSAARFSAPNDIVSDGTNLYVADQWNNNIRKIVISTGVVTTLAGSGAAGAADGTGAAATFNGPYGITIDPAFTNLYVTDQWNNNIRKIVIATGVVTTLAGSGAMGAVDGTGAAAAFNSPSGITTDGTNLYVADSGNNKIRQIVINTGAVSSFTGTASTAELAGWADGPAATATFTWPSGITTDGTNFYVADSGNNKIRQIAVVGGAVSSFTGTTSTPEVTGATDGAAATATFFGPYGITNDGANLYVTDIYNNKIRQIAIAGGLVSSLTGAANTAVVQGAADGSGTAATFWNPFGITATGGKLYVADTYNSMVRTVNISTAAVATLAGMPVGTDGTGGAASFYGGGQVTTDGTNLYVADGGNNKIRQIVIATGVVTTLAGSGVAGAADGPGAAATFNYPSGITADGANLYVADMNNYKIRKIVIATGVVSSFTGTANTAGTIGATDGAATAAKFKNPSGITTDGTNLYVADLRNHKIRQIVIATGAVTSLTGAASTAGVAGAADGTGAAVTFNRPSSVATDGTNLYVVDQGNHKIRLIVIATGVVSSLTGVANTAGAAGATDGTGAAVTFYSPRGITTDGTNLYVTDAVNQKIRQIVIASGAVSSLTGTSSTAGVLGAADGAATAATFNYPHGITTDGVNLFVTDAGNRTIRKIQ